MVLFVGREQLDTGVFVAFTDRECLKSGSVKVIVEEVYFDYSVFI